MKIHLNTCMICLLKRKKVVKLRKWSFNFSYLKTFIFLWTLLLQVNALFMNVVGTLPIQCISCWVVFFHSFWFEFNRVCVNCSFIHLLLWQSKPHPFFKQSIKQIKLLPCFICIWLTQTIFVQFSLKLLSIQFVR